jgi:hypothetical protein
MAEPKTKKTGESVDAFLARVTPAERREECRTVIEMMGKATAAPPKMWGTSIVAFGDRRYRYADGREGDWFQIGFSPRKNNLTLYLCGGFDRYASVLKKLGKFKTGQSCLYVQKLSDVDLSVLQKLMNEAVKFARNNPGAC